MIRRYVIESAALSCQYGQSSTGGVASCELKPPKSRHITVGKSEKLIANEMDIERSCFNGCFGVCASPDRVEVSLEVRDVFSNHHQIVAHLNNGDGDAGVGACEPEMLIPWQNAKRDVFFADASAVLNDGWSLCANGFGIVALITSGQDGENPAKEILDKMNDLEIIVDAYMEDNGIDEKYKEELMESIILWNGYYPLPWSFTTNERTRTFCDYMQNVHPHLFGFFERGLYLNDKKYGVIDLSLFGGMTKAFQEDDLNLYFKHLSPEMVEDSGMMNAFLEAFRPEFREYRENSSTTENLRTLLNEHKLGEYNPENRINGLLDYPSSDEDLAEIILYRYDPEGMSQTDANIAWLKEVMQGEQDSFGQNEMYDTSIVDSFWENFDKIRRKKD